MGELVRRSPVRLSPVRLSPMASALLMPPSVVPAPAPAQPPLHELWTNPSAVDKQRVAAAVRRAAQALSPAAMLNSAANSRANRCMSGTTSLVATRAIRLSGPLIDSAVFEGAPGTATA